MGINKIVSALNGKNSVRIENIASSIGSFQNPDEFKDTYAKTIAMRTILGARDRGVSVKNSGHEISLEFENGLYLVRIATEEVIDEIRKTKPLEKYAINLQREIRKNGFEGVVQFLPFQIHGQKVRNIMSNKADIGFVDLGYSKGSLDQTVYHHNT